MISSTKNPKVQWIRRLQRKGTARQSEGLFVVEGVRLTEETFKSSWKINYLVYTEGLKNRGQKLIDELKEKDIQVEEVSPHVMQAISDTKSPQGILAVVSMQSLFVQDQVDFVLILDQIREPGNLGTILRSSLAAGVQMAILTPGTVDPYSPKVLRAGMGAQMKLPIQFQAWNEIESIVKDSKLSVFLSDVGSGKVYHQCDLSKPLALIVGGEAEGATEVARQVADSMIHIPMLGGCESLNVSVSAGILLFEIARQRETSK